MLPAKRSWDRGKHARQSAGGETILHAAARLNTIRVWAASVLAGRIGPKPRSAGPHLHPHRGGSRQYLLPPYIFGATAQLKVCRSVSPVNEKVIRGFLWHCRKSSSESADALQTLIPRDRWLPR